MSARTEAQEVSRRYPTCSSIPFEYVAYLFGNVSKAQKPALRRKHLEAFRKRYINREADDIFQLYRLILPWLDRERGTYGMKESMLGSTLIKACGVPESAKEAKAVKEWKNPRTEEGGDFAAVLERHLFKSNCGRQKDDDRRIEYSVGQLNADLDRLARAEDRAAKADTLKSVITRTTPEQMKWIVRIIIGNPKAGLSESTVLRDFHEDAEKLYDSTMDLRRVCRMLKDPTARHQIKDVELGVPARSQLAIGKSTLREVHQAMDAKDFVVEVKFDGERCQLHKIGNRIAYFSRRGIDQADAAGFGIFDGVARRQIVEEECVLDGELVVWNSHAGCYEPFGSLRSTVKAATGRTGHEGPIEYDDFRDEGPEKTVHVLPTLEQLEIHYVAFDIMHVGGRSVTDLPLSERHRLLRSAIADAPAAGFPVTGELGGRIVPLLPDATFLSGYCLSKTGTAFEDIADMFNEAIAMQEEGVVVKALDSRWKLNDRSGSWVKMKPEYVFNHEVDALIIGGYYGSGRRDNSISEFLLGVLDTSISSDEKKFVSFCRVGTGLSERERFRVETTIGSSFKRLKRPPKHYRTTGNSKETPDEWVADPSASVVLQVKADVRTVPSSVFATGYTLRFPRAMAVRSDKGHEDVMTLQELEDLVRRRGGNLPRKRNATSGTPLRQRRSKARPVSVPPRFVRTPVKARRERPQFLKGVTVCFTDYGKHDKIRLEEIAQELGAAVHMTPTRQVHFVLGADPDSQLVERVAQNGKHDVVSVEWLLECEDKGVMLPRRPQDYLARATTAADKMTDLLKCEDPGADLDDEDIKRVVEGHLNQLTMLARHGDIVDGQDLVSSGLSTRLSDGKTLDGCAFCWTIGSPSDAKPPAGCPSRSAFIALEEWKQLRLRSSRRAIESKLMLRGAESTEVLTRETTHVLFDPDANEAFQTPSDFLSWASTHCDEGASMTSLRNALTGEASSRFCRWLRHADVAEQLPKGPLIACVDQLPSFVTGSVRTVRVSGQKVLDVDAWPWADFMIGESDDRRRKEAIGSPPRSFSRRHAITSAATTPKKKTQRSSQASARTTSRWWPGDEEALKTPPPKKTRTALRSPASVERYQAPELIDTEQSRHVPRRSRGRRQPTEVTDSDLADSALPRVSETAIATETSETVSSIAMRTRSSKAATTPQRGRSDKSNVSSQSNKSRRLPSFFEAILDESTEDDEETAAEIVSSTTAPMEIDRPESADRPRSRSRSRSPRVSVTETTPASTKGRVSVRDKLRSLKKQSR